MSQLSDLWRCDQLTLCMLCGLLKGVHKGILFLDCVKICCLNPQRKFAIEFLQAFKSGVSVSIENES